MYLLDHGEDIWMNAMFTLTLGPLFIIAVAWGTIALPRAVESRATRWALWIGGGVAWLFMIALATGQGLITALYPPATLGVMVLAYITALLPVGALVLLVVIIQWALARTRQSNRARGNAS